MDGQDDDEMDDHDDKISHIYNLVYFISQCPSQISSCSSP